MKHSVKHIWKSTATDNNGVPINYTCVKCGLELKIESKAEKMKKFLIKKYSSQKA